MSFFERLWTWRPWFKRRQQTSRRIPYRLEVESLETRVVPSLFGNQLFPDDNPWNQPITNAPVAASSAAMIDAVNGLVPLHPDFGTVYHGVLNGIPYNVVSGDHPKVTVIVDAYAAESDNLPMPIPDNAVIEGDTPTGPALTNNSDRHLLVYDKDNNIVYEGFGAYRPGEMRPDGQIDFTHWHLGSQAIWDLNQNTFRTPGYTSADAAGLTILPGLVRPDEVFEQGVIEHALRFTVSLTSNAYTFPASHHTYVADPADTVHPRMGERFRLKSSVDITQLPGYGVPGYEPNAIILTALQKYGMIVADNGGTGFISGAPSPLWNDEILHWLSYVKMSDFEVVDLTPVVAGLEQSSGPAGTLVTINGLNFAGTAGTTQVYFGTTLATIASLTNTQIVVTAPAGTGTALVTVRSGYGNSAAALPFAYSSAPTITLSAANAVYSGNPYTGISAVATGAGGATVSGVFVFTYYVGAAVNGAGMPTAPTNVGTYTVTAHFTSADSSYPDADSAPATFQISPAQTAVVLTSSAPVSSFKQPVTFTASVSLLTGAGISTGTIQFRDGTKLLATASLVLGEASFTTSSLSQGNHTITATYLADPNFAAPAAPTALQQLVVKPAGRPKNLSAATLTTGAGTDLLLADAGSDSDEFAKPFAKRRR